MNSKIKIVLSVAAFLVAAAAAYVMLDLGLRKVDSTDLVERFVEGSITPGYVSWRKYLLLNDDQMFWTVFAAIIFYTIGGLFASFSRFGFIIFQICALPLAWYYVLCIVVSPIYALLAIFASFKTVLGFVYFVEPVFALIVFGIHISAYQKLHGYS